MVEMVQLTEDEMERIRWVDGTTVAEIRQTDAQYGNPYVEIAAYSDDDGEIVVYRENTGSETNEWRLEALPEDPQSFLEAAVREWIGNDEDPLAAYRWGVSSPSDDAVDEGHEGPVRILVEGDFCGYSPVGFVTESDGWEPIEFGSHAEAAEWIAEQESGMYRLGHNEMGRPTYTIVAA